MEEYYKISLQQRKSYKLSKEHGKFYKNCHGKWKNLPETCKIFHATYKILIEINNWLLEWTIPEALFEARILVFGSLKTSSWAFEKSNPKELITWYRITTTYKNDLKNSTKTTNINSKGLLEHSSMEFIFKVATLTYTDSNKSR